MRITGCWIFGFLMLLGSASAQTQPQGTPPTRLAVPETRAAIPATPEGPRLILKAALTSDSPTVFAERLSTLLGAQVRLPPSLTISPTLPPGRYYSEQILERVGDQINAATGNQGVWREVFVFQSAPHSGKPMHSRLKSAGAIRISRKSVLFSDLAHALAEAVGCEVEMPKDVPGRYSLSMNQVPVEKAFSDLAAQSGLILTPVVAFSFPAADSSADAVEKEEARTQEREETLATQMSEQSMALLNRTAQLDTDMGVDLFSPEFDWGSMKAQDWLGLGLTLTEVQDLRNAADTQREEQREVEELTAQAQAALQTETQGGPAPEVHDSPVESAPMP